MCRDRVEKEEFTLTHEFLAEMLGVRRPTVTVIAATLQTAGVIAYHRGAIRILNRKKALPVNARGVLEKVDRFPSPGVTAKHPQGGRPCPPAYCITALASSAIAMFGNLLRPA
jgi:hypothetical protein